MKNRGPPADLFDGRGTIGICKARSELTPATPISGDRRSG